MLNVRNLEDLIKVQNSVKVSSKDGGKHSPTENMLVFHINIQPIRKKLIELEILLGLLPCHIICVNEHLLIKDEIDMYVSNEADPRGHGESHLVTKTVNYVK